MEQNQNPKRSTKRRTPFQRNRRLQGQWLTYLLIGVIVIFLALSIVTEDKAFSESENRSLAQFPELSGILEGDFLNDLGDWFADQFPGRDLWMSLNLKANQLLGQKEASGVYLCREDYLMQVPSQPNEPQVQRNLDAINAFAAAHPNLNMVMTVVPNAVTVHADKLPENAPVRDQLADLKSLTSRLTGASFVDVTGVLMEHSDEYLFYKTDHHWTSLAAAYAFETIAPHMGIPAPGLDSYTVYTVSVIHLIGTDVSRSLKITCIYIRDFIFIIHFQCNGRFYRFLFFRWQDYRCYFRCGRRLFCRFCGQYSRFQRRRCRPLRWFVAITICRCRVCAFRVTDNRCFLNLSLGRQ